MLLFLCCCCIGISGISKNSVVFVGTVIVGVCVVFYDYIFIIKFIQQQCHGQNLWRIWFSCIPPFWSIIYVTVKNRVLFSPDLWGIWSGKNKVLQCTVKGIKDRLPTLKKNSSLFGNQQFKQYNTWQCGIYIDCVLHYIHEYPVKHG